MYFIGRGRFLDFFLTSKDTLRVATVCWLLEMAPVVASGESSKLNTSGDLAPAFV